VSTVLSSSFIYLTSIPEVLGKSSDTNEILWNFSCFPDSKKRLTLGQNPHFYELLPTLPWKYGDKFRAKPIEDFLREKISVLTDNPAGRVYLEIAQKTWVFGNVCVPKDAIIFKGSTLSILSSPSLLHYDIFSDVCGKLEGESIVGEAIRGKSNLWYIQEPLGLATPKLKVGVRVKDKDWGVPIRRMLQKPNGNTNLRITDQPPSSVIDSPPSPIPLDGSSNFCPICGINSSCGYSRRM